VSSWFLEFAIVIAISRERESRPAPEVPMPLQLSMPDRYRFEVGERGLRPTGEALFMIASLT
jgi:hypothetical protein